MQAHTQAATAAVVHALDGTAAVSVPSATVSDGAHAAEARVFLATTASQPFALQPQDSLPWCSPERCSVPYYGPMRNC